MTKIEVISQKPSKNWIFGKNGHFLTVFGQKRAKNDFFFKNPLGTFFYTPKALPNCKVSEKTNVRIPRYPVTNGRTNGRTDEQTNGRTTVNP